MVACGWLKYFKSGGCYDQGLATLENRGNIDGCEGRIGRLYFPKLRWYVIRYSLQETMVCPGAGLGD